MTATTGTVIGAASPAIQELAMLEGLMELLEGANQSLARGEPETLLETSPRIARKTADLMAAALTISRAPVPGEAQQRRRELLASVRRQCSFSMAMLRRWRRSILLRRQLLELREEPLPYTEVLDGRWY